MVDSSLLHTFSIDALSEVDGKRYFGTFTSKKLSVRDISQLGVRRAQLCGGLKFDVASPGSGLDIDTYNINSMLAHLDLAITDAPEWWNLDILTDMEIMSKVYKEVVSFESNFSGSRHRRAGQGGSEKAQTGSNDTGVPQPVVVGEVQASLEP